MKYGLLESAERNQMESVKKSKEISFLINENERQRARKIVCIHRWASYLAYVFKLLEIHKYIDEFSAEPCEICTSRIRTKDALMLILSMVKRRPTPKQ